MGKSQMETTYKFTEVSEHIGGMGGG